MSARFFFPNALVPGDWDIGSSGILVPRNGTFSGNVQAASFNGAPLPGFRNKLRNAQGLVQARGNSVVIAGTGAYGIDGWNFTQIGGGAMTMSASTDVPTNSKIANSIRCTVSTADAAMAATDIYELRHVIEGYDILDLVGNQFILGFWVRSAKTGAHSLNLLNGAATAYFVTTFNVIAANTWEWKTVPVTVGLDTTVAAAGWNFGNGIGLYAQWVVAAGSNFFTATLNAWTAGGLYATAAQPNGMDTVGNIFAIAGPRLERCTSMQTELEAWVPVHTEVARNERYAQLSATSAAGQAQSATSAHFAFPFRTAMRAVPSAVVLGSGPSLTVPGLGTAGVAGTWATGNASTLSVDMLFTRTAGTWTQGNALNINDTASALLFSAEL
jgi:hypothetical protein